MTNKSSVEHLQTADSAHSRNGVNTAGNMQRMAYLVSTYPAVSHTFILRELQGLRALGRSIDTASVNAPDRRPEDMGAYEKQEAKDTFFIKRQGVAGAVAALWFWLRKRPRTLLSVVRQSLRLGKGGNPLYGLAYAAEAALLARWMLARKVDTLHVHFGNSGATVGMLVKHLTECHLSYTIHGPDEFDDVPGQHLALKMQAADRVICISQFAKSQLMRISHPDHWHKFQVCRLGVDPAQFSFSQRPLDKPRLDILSVGRLAPAKAQVLLVHACALLKDQGRAFHLTLVGDGPDRPRVEAAIAQHQLAEYVTLTGALNQQAVRAHFEKADIFVLASLAEGIPVVLMEAMSSGVPCVSTPVNGIPELIQHERTGLMATPGDVESLAQQLHRLMDDPPLRRDLALAALEKVQADFDLNRNVQALSQIFSSFHTTQGHG